jgi:hypothetical protein
VRGKVKEDGARRSDRWATYMTVTSGANARHPRHTPQSAATQQSPCASALANLRTGDISLGPLCPADQPVQPELDQSQHVTSCAMAL